MIYFATRYEEDVKKNICIFGTFDEISDNTITGEAIDAHTMRKIDLVLNNTDELCEEYLMTTDCSLELIKSTCKSHGLIENDKLLECSWG